MWNKLQLLTIILVISTCLGYSQIEIRPSVGVGTYSMTNLKEVLNQAALESGLGLKTTESFPAYTYFGFDVIQTMNKRFGLGISSGFYSTGGRNHYADYSGSYREDIMVNSWNVGLLGSFKDTLNGNLIYGLELASGIKFSNIKFESELNVFDHMEKSSNDFQNKGWWMEPQIRIGQKFYKGLTCSAFIGYEFKLKSKLIFKEINQNSSLEKINWSGIRAGLSAAYSFAIK
jgi:hypothetical protein